MCMNKFIKIRFNKSKMNRNITQLKCISVVILAIFGFQIIAVGSIQKNETQFYIAPNGNDEWSGKLSEPNSDNSDGPFATLEGARTEVQEYISDGLTHPLTVWIRGGEYVLDSAIIFSVKNWIEIFFLMRKLQSG